MNVLLYGGGVNSTAAAIGMFQCGIPIDLIIFADTGGEHPHTYEYIKSFNNWLCAHGLPAVTMVYYTDKDGNRLTLENECLRGSKLPSIAYGVKSCSIKHKINPQEKFCNNFPVCKAVRANGHRVTQYIGYDAGETRRVEHAAIVGEKDKKYIKKYPLHEWGWNRDECVRVIERAGLPVPQKSSCFFCPSMKKNEIQALWEKYPQLFQRAIEMERTAAKTLTSIKGLGRRWSWTRKSLKTRS
jgi:3'-phosphoadenosine 5'-phosphosulfate sulfotransferase (PAPS reductase)/FAD synthetase